mmetsp:Transcript_14725/g.29715  ORF Transcript_14725/g.29715 Transcript_14725/m.29715 type:complete len:115 (+) Transcript_14725:1240-1584(+)
MQQPLFLLTANFSFPFLSLPSIFFSSSVSFVERGIHYFFDFWHSFFLFSQQFNLYISNAHLPSSTLHMRESRGGGGEELLAFNFCWLIQFNWSMQRGGCLNPVYAHDTVERERK